MILADKIINERKKNGWSQEDLAEQLSVSRQSVSKWEGAQAVPDIQKIIAMADIFGVSTDYLLKDNIEPEEYVPSDITCDNASVIAGAARESIRTVSYDEACEFLDKSKANAPRIANAVSACIISPVVLIGLAGLSEESIFGISENLAAGIGLVVLLLIVAAAVFILVTTGMQMKQYEFFELERIETAYGVSGMVREKKRAFESKRTLTTAIGVIICILCPMPLLIASLSEAKDYIVVLMVSVLLVIVSIAVNMFIRVGNVWRSYEKLLQEGDYTSHNKEVNKKNAKIGGVYWSVVLAGYLAWSFITMNWHITWIVWPIAAVLYGVITAVMSTVTKNGD